MSLVTTTVTPELRLTPFTGVSETIRERSGIARAEAVYSAYGTWPATGGGDTRSISFSFSLDPDYGYVMMDANAVFIMNSDVSKMEAAGALEITTDTGPGASQKESQWYQYQNLPSRQNDTGTTEIGAISASYYNSIAWVTGTNSLMIFSLLDKPSALLYPFPGVNTVDVTAMFAEAVTSEPVQAYRFYMRFLQYDITQGYHYAIQSPTLTR